MSHPRASRETPFRGDEEGTSIQKKWIRHECSTVDATHFSVLCKQARVSIVASVGVGECAHDLEGEVH